MLSQICCLPVCVFVCVLILDSLFIGLIALRTHTRVPARTVRGNDLVCYIFCLFLNLTSQVSSTTKMDHRIWTNVRAVRKGWQRKGSTNVCWRVVFFFVICLKQVARFKFEISSTKLSFLLVHFPKSMTRILNKFGLLRWTPHPPFSAQRAVVIF